MSINTWKFVTIIVMFHITVGLILASTASNDRMYNYAYDQSDKLTTKVNSIDTSQDDVGNLQRDFATQRAGNEWEMSSSIWDVLKYGTGFWHWTAKTPETQYETFLLWVARIMNSLIGLYTGMLIFMLLFNRKND